MVNYLTKHLVEGIFQMHSIFWQRTISSVRESVGFLEPQKVHERVLLILVVSRGDLGAHREGPQQGDPPRIKFYTTVQ